MTTVLCKLPAKRGFCTRPVHFSNVLRRPPRQLRPTLLDFGQGNGALLAGSLALLLSEQDGGPNRTSCVNPPIARKGCSNDLVLSSRTVTSASVLYQGAERALRNMGSRPQYTTDCIWQAKNLDITCRTTWVISGVRCTAHNAVYPVTHISQFFLS
jgi:hypothetical protein